MSTYEMVEPAECAACGQHAALGPEAELCRRCTIMTCTPHQRSVLKAVRRLQPTTTGDVADEMGYASATTARHHLTALQEIGLVTWEPHVHRTIRERFDWVDGFLVETLEETS